MGLAVMAELLTPLAGDGDGDGDGRADVAIVWR